MKDIGIMDGDLLAVHETRDVRNGRVCYVARIDDEVTVGFEKQGNKVELCWKTVNLNFSSLSIRFEQNTIEGLAIGVIRNGEWLQ